MNDQNQNVHKPCGLGRRLLVITYDTLLVIALWIVAGFIALPFSGAQQAFTDIFYTLYLLLVWYGYLGWCWTSSGQTLGMRAWKVKLLALDGRTLTWRAALLRSLISILGALPLAAGYWTSLWREDKACWHDRVTSTRLVRI